MSKRPYDHPGTRLTPVRLDQSQVDAIDDARGPLTRSDFIRGAVDLALFHRNGTTTPIEVRIVGRDKDQRLVVDDGGPLMTDGIDGEIVNTEVTE